MHVGSKMLTFIKLCVKSFPIMKMGCFDISKWFLHISSMCMKNQIRVFGVRYCRHLWVQMLNCLECFILCVGSMDVMTTNDCAWWVMSSVCWCTLDGCLYLISSVGDLLPIVAAKGLLLLCVTWSFCSCEPCHAYILIKMYLYFIEGPDDD
jgi:hypothetical protein